MEILICLDEFRFYKPNYFICDTVFLIIKNFLERFPPLFENIYK